MAERIVIDPITRIEGHLRIEASLDGNNTISEAYSSGTMVRGIEKILRGAIRVKPGHLLNGPAGYVQQCTPLPPFAR